MSSSPSRAKMSEHLQAEQSSVVMSAALAARLDTAAANLPSCWFVAEINLAFFGWWRKRVAASENLEL